MAGLDARLEVRLDSSQLAELQRLALTTERTPSAIARLAIRDYITRQRELRPRPARRRPTAGR